MADERSSLSSAATERRRAVRRETGDPALVDAGLESSLRSAEQIRDMRALAEVVTTTGVRFEAMGRLEEGMAELDYAAIRVAGDPDALAILLGTKATFALALGDHALARTSIAQARASSPGDPVSCRYLAANEAMVAAELLEPDSGELCARALELTDDSDDAEHLHTFVLSWWIPLLYAGGSLRQAAPWERTLHDYATRWIHPHRLTDAAVFRAARAHIDQPDREWSGENVPVAATNWAARLRIAALSLHWASFTRHWGAASVALGNMSEIRQKHHPGATENVGIYRAVVDVARGRTLEFTEAPPERVNLMTLGAVLAGAEAAAKAARPSLAGTWLELLETLPDWVESSLEWPVSRRRVAALLLVRTGATRDGIARMRSAVEWAERAGYPGEQALARLQLGTLLALADSRSRERQWRPIREQGWNELIALNVDPAPHAYDASRTLELKNERNSPPLLSPRELETLKYLADGLSYKETALEMNCGWRTVQTLAHRAYGKLDVSGRHQAVIAARLRGLL